MDLIKSENFRHMHILNIWFLAINVFFVVCSYFNIFGLNRLKVGNYAIYLGIAVIFEVTILIFRSKLEKISFVPVYISIVVLLSYSITVSVGSPYLAATMYLVLAVLIASTYIDTMLRMVLIQSIFSAVFIVTSFRYKPASVADQDLYNIIIFMTLAMVLHYSFQRARMQQYVTFQNNIRIQRELEVKSSFDALTSLLNRGRFFSMAGEVIRHADGEYIAICLLDLDGFKQINDKLGHQMGDKAIQIAGATITDTLEIDLSEKWSFSERAVADKLSFAGRLGGDEFIALIRGKENRDEIEELLKQMLSNLNTVHFGDLNGLHASFGVTEITPEDRDIDDAYTRADSALYESKRSGKNQIHFSEGMKESADAVL